MRTGKPAPQDVEQIAAKQNEGKAFEHIWICKVGDEWLVNKDYYAVLGGVVYWLKHTRREPSEDSVFQVVTECVCIGDYDPSKWYQPIQRKYHHGVLKALLNVEAP